MKGHRIRYDAAELAWLEANCQLVISEYHSRFVALFGRAVSRENLLALRKRKGWSTGRTGQFAKGSEPVNKGQKCPDGVGGRHPNARAQHFQKGGMPHTYRGAGHERIDSKDGYVILIIDQENPWTGAKTRPVLKHRHLWEQAHGPVPAGHVLKCIDGDKTNCDPANWEPIPRAMIPYLGGFRGIDYDRADPELKPTVMAIAKLRHAAKARRTP